MNQNEIEPNVNETMIMPNPVPGGPDIEVPYEDFGIEDTEVVK